MLWQHHSYPFVKQEKFGTKRNFRSTTLHINTTTDSAPHIELQLSFYRVLTLLVALCLYRDTKAFRLWCEEGHVSGYSKAGFAASWRQHSRSPGHASTQCCSPGKKKRKKITSSWSWHFPETVCAALRCQLCKNYGRISHRVGVIQKKKKKKTELIEVFPWIQEDLWRICTNFMVKGSCGYYFNHDSWYSQSRYSVLNHFAVVCTCLFMFFFLFWTVTTASMKRMTKGPKGTPDWS